MLLVRILLLLLLLLGLEEELSPVALAQLQRLARRVVAAGGGGVGDVLAPLVVHRLPAGDGWNALARTLEINAFKISSQSSIVATHSVRPPRWHRRHCKRCRPRHPSPPLRQLRRPRPACASASSPRECPTCCRRAGGRRPKSHEICIEKGREYEDSPDTHSTECGKCCNSCMLTNH